MDPRLNTERLAFIILCTEITTDDPTSARLAPVMSRENCERIVVECDISFPLRGRGRFEKQLFSICLRRENEEMQSIERHLEDADGE